MNLLISALLLELIFLFYFLNKNTDYIVKDNGYCMLKSIESHILKNTGEVSLLDLRYVDNARIISFIYHGEFGVAVYIKGYNRRLKLSWINYGDTRCFSRIISTDEGKYMIISGDNRDYLIDHIETEVKSQTIKVKTSGERYFLKIWPLTQNEALDGITLLRLYDKNNINITQELMYENVQKNKNIEDFVFIT
ncbi:hypothetical protein [Clostridium polynesiense]|uniref:hypothetical protein n=1 Tax=Clostridium polynesiense TaxID=1325933 RepID=UPI00059028F2|nr:hypothetical protein [Clostridium polynesiense]